MRHSSTLLKPGDRVRRIGDTDWREIEYAVRCVPASMSASRNTRTIIAIRFTDGSQVESPLDEVWEIDE
jgi:hypothetical protein